MTTPGFTLPPVDLVRETLAILATTAQKAGDLANANALNRADEQLGKGVYAAVQVSVDGSLLVPSKEAAGTVYRVGALPCSCKAGANGRPCWHAALAEAVFVARGEVVALIDSALLVDPADDAAYAELLAGDDPARYR